jgi:short subunit dehydrogenase-like uncharacterized protein
MATSNTERRKYDVVLFGATGFTGRLIAEYIARTYGSSISWAIAGRNSEKLAAVRATIADIDPSCSEVGIIEADHRDWASLVMMANQTKVVLTTVGPYVEYGEPLVRACLSGGADYADITGEPEFVDEMVASYHDAAREKGLRIVNCCGFDSIPHDLGVLFTVGQLPSDQPMTVKGFVQAKGTFSGGTWQSAVKAMSRLRETQKAKQAAKGAGSNGSGRRVRGIKPSFSYDRQVGGWVFPLPTIDPEIVRRSAKALDQYGPDFRYGHYGKSSSLPKVVMGAAGIGAVFALAQLKPTRNWLLSKRPSGVGPSAEERENGWFKVTFVAEAGGRNVVTRVTGGDPGYGETSKMAAEAALCLALDRDKLPDHAGVLTPAVAMGDVLIERLRSRGIGFEVVEE